MQLKNIMTTNVSTVNPDQTIDQAAMIMKEKNVGAVPVCQGNNPVGIITDRDISIRAVAEGQQNTNVKNIMSSSLVYGTPEMSVEEATQLMSENQIRRLPIIENDQLVGIVSLGDLATNSKSDMEAAKALTSISVPSKPQ